MHLDHVKELEKTYLLGAYARYEVLIDRGSGAYLIDKSNKRYLDLLAGIGVNFSAYAIDVDLDQIGEGIERFIPNVLGDFCPPNDAAWVARQVFQEGIFLGRKRYATAGT